MDDVNRPSEFNEQLRDTLGHLYDPTYIIPVLVEEALTSSGERMPDSLRLAIRRGIHALRPDKTAPRHTRSWRMYNVLALRYLEQLTQEQAACKLGITVRQLARNQVEAIELLAEHLWTTHVQKSRVQDDLHASNDILVRKPDSGALESERQTQIQKELASLEHYVVKPVTDVDQALSDALQIARALAEDRGIRLTLGSVEKGLTARIHASAFRQVLVTGATTLIRAMKSGRVQVSAWSDTEMAKIEMIGGPACAPLQQENWFVEGLLATEGAHYECSVRDDDHVLHIFLPCSEHVVVLFIEDNKDLIHFYRLCLQDSVYEIVHESTGIGALSRLASIEPDVIVLDLMLPDVDGWRLLAQLHEHPVSRPAPIIVSSVVREEELALSMGASVCLTKPIRRHELLEALDQVLNQAAVEY